MLDKNARAREKYVADVAKLDPFDNSGRSALKEHWRRPMPPETRVFVKAFRPGTGPQEGSSGRANITNPKVNQAVRTAGRLGRGLGVAGAALAAGDIATADDPWRAAVANAGAKVGGVLGGAGGASLGTLTGPGAVAASPILGAAGAVGGGNMGYEAGEELYDFFRKYLR